MAQDVFNEIDPANTSGTELSVILNDFKDALMSGLKGPSRPTQVVAGGTWVDDSVPGVLRFKIYTGTTDITIFTLNLTTSTVSIQNSDDFFEITKVSEDAVGPYLSFFKKRINDAARVESGDVVGEIQLKAIGTGGGTQVIGRVRYVTTEDVTPTSAGAYYVFEGTRAGQASLTEFMRLIDGRMGIGVTAPSAAVHVRSTTGIKNERLSDDAVAAKDIIRKARVTGSGQVQSGDELSSRESASTDVAGTEFTGTRIVSKATQTHTASARGTVISLETVNDGETTLAERAKIDSAGLELKVPLIQEALNRKTQTFASVSEVLALDAQRSLIEVTGTTSMSLKGIDANSKSKSFYLFNSTNQNIIIVHQSPDASALNRIAVNGEASMTLQPGKCVEFIRRDSLSRWSPIIEGNTGITYNEATALFAKLVAASWNHDLIVDFEKAVGSQMMPKPSGLAVDSAGGFVAVIGHVGTGGQIAGAVKEEIGGAWGTSSVLTGADWNGAQFQRAAATYFITGGFNVNAGFMTVRTSGTKRSFIGQALLGGPGFTPNAAVDDGNIDNSMAWEDVATDGTYYYCVASSGAQRIGRREVVLAPYTWTYISAVTIDVPLRSIAYGGGRFVAVGGVIGASPNHAAWVSTNGTTWTSYAMPNETTVSYTVVRYCNNNFIAIGGTSGIGMVVLSSTDGTSWSLVYTAAIGVTLTDVAYSGGLYIVTTLDSAAIVSTDGVSFTSVKSLPMNRISTGGGGKFYGTNQFLQGPGIYKSLTPSF